MKTVKAIFLSDWLDNPYKVELAKHLRYRGVEVEEHCWNLIFLPKVLHIISEGQLGILHLHTLHPFFWSRNYLFRSIKLLLFICQVKLLKIRDIKTIWTVHEWSDKVAGGKHNIPKSHAKVLSYFIDGFIAHCETIKSEITKAFNLEGKSKIFVIPHGNYIGCYENTITSTEARKILGIPEENTVFLLFGNLYRYKGVLESIDAFQLLLQNKISLIIAGSPDEANLGEQINEKIKEFENISFIPKRIPDNEVQIFMNAADCVLVPYQVFTTSGVAILAASFGKACVAPNLGFFKDLLDSSGSILYNSNSDHGLSHAMKSAIEDREKLAEMGKHNFELAKQWNWSYVAEETIKVYSL